MASVVFEKLWAIASKREGELFTNALELAHAHMIPSAVAAIRLARALRESGRPFFEYCDALCKQEEDRYLHRMKRQGRLSERDMKLVKELLAKAAKKGW